MTRVKKARHARAPEVRDSRHATSGDISLMGKLTNFTRTMHFARAAPRSMTGAETRVAGAKSMVPMFLRGLQGRP